MQVKQDKEKHLLEQLEEIDATGYQCSGLKRLRAKPTPHFTKIEDSQGKLIPLDQYAQAAADYLEKPNGVYPSQIAQIKNLPVNTSLYKTVSSWLMNRHSL